MASSNTCIYIRKRSLLILKVKALIKHYVLYIHVFFFFHRQVFFFFPNGIHKYMNEYIINT